MTSKLAPLSWVEGFAPTEESTKVEAKTEPVPPDGKRYTRRSRSLSYRKRLTHEERVELRLLVQEIGPVDRPQTRGDCVNGQRPCPFVTCRHHLYLEVERTGSVKLNFPNQDVDTIPNTCSLDVAEQGGATLDEVGNLLNVTRERTRQIETKAIANYRAAYRRMYGRDPDLPDDGDPP